MLSEYIYSTLWLTTLFEKVGDERWKDEKVEMMEKGRFEHHEMIRERRSCGC